MLNENGSRNLIVSVMLHSLGAATTAIIAAKIESLSEREVLMSLGEMYSFGDIDASVNEQGNLVWVLV